MIRYLEISGTDGLPQRKGMGSIFRICFRATISQLPSMARRLSNNLENLSNELDC